MKRIKTVLYECEICGKRYERKEDAEICERQHKAISYAHKAIFSPTDRKNRYPESVLVVFKDGESARYYRKAKNQ